MDFFSELLLFYFRYLPLIAGAYITISILRVPDLTLEVSWSISAIVACLSTQIIAPYLSPFIGIIVGALSGLLTGIIFIIIGRKKLLSGLISYTILIAIGYHILGNKASIYTVDSVTKFGLSTFSANIYYFISSTILVLLIVVFMKSKYGIKMRLIGENPYSSLFYKISINNTFLIGFVIANAIIGFGGALWGVYYGFASNTQGIGLVFTSFLSLLLGEEIVYLFKLNKRVNYLVFIIGTFLFVLINQVNEFIIIQLQLMDFPIKSTDKNLILAVLLVVLIAFRRTNTTKSEIVSQW